MFSNYRPVQKEDGSIEYTRKKLTSPLVAKLLAFRASPRRRHRLSRAVAGTATKLLPLVTLLDTLQPQIANESVFRTRRKKLQAHLAEVYQELQEPRPRHQMLAHTFQALAELVREEIRDISKDELKQAAKEMALATLQNAPGLISAANQARLLS